jgi:hypothetical protein
MEEALDTNKNQLNSSNHNHINKSPDDDAESGTTCSDTISADEKGNLYWVNRIGYTPRAYGT